MSPVVPRIASIFWCALLPSHAVGVSSSSHGSPSVKTFAATRRSHGRGGGGRHPPRHHRGSGGGEGGARGDGRQRKNDDNRGEPGASHSVGGYNGGGHSLLRREALDEQATINESGARAGGDGHGHRSGGRHPVVGGHGDVGGKRDLESGSQNDASSHSGGGEKRRIVGDGRNGGPYGGAQSLLRQISSTQQRKVAPGVDAVPVSTEEVIEGNPLYSADGSTGVKSSASNPTAAKADVGSPGYQPNPFHAPPEVHGEQGDPGPPGPPGVQGVKGPRGRRGNAGVPGRDAKRILTSVAGASAELEGMSGFVTKAHCLGLVVFNALLVFAAYSMVLRSKQVKEEEEAKDVNSQEAKNTPEEKGEEAKHTPEEKGEEAKHTPEGQEGKGGDSQGEVQPSAPGEQAAPSSDRSASKLLAVPGATSRDHHGASSSQHHDGSKHHHKGSSSHHHDGSKDHHRGSSSHHHDGSKDHRGSSSGHHDGSKDDHRGSSSHHHDGSKGDKTPHEHHKSPKRHEKSPGHHHKSPAGSN
eukprot:TRINITY_DN1054_c0_g1_i3.p1 TRINITY_DN1054_c0_g1~~TRINITY_DN1054_c0_g1_i3.p1  ORF type:complete len:526 (+),score=96.11 TRINITY_DN1054_c0_g1_i3:121-1698(+)